MNLCKDCKWFEKQDQPDYWRMVHELDKSSNNPLLYRNLCNHPKNKKMIQKECISVISGEKIEEVTIRDADCESLRSDYSFGINSCGRQGSWFEYKPVKDLPKK